MRKIIAGIILPMFIISFIGCTSCKDRAAQKKTEIIDKVGDMEDKIEENVYPLPTSADVLKMLADLQIGYSIGLTNPVGNIRKYFSSSKRALNLGAYGADLSYATLYNVQQEVLNYLDAIRILTDALNMAKVYDPEIYSKIEKNFDNRDELVNILQTVFNDTYQYLSDNQQTSLALLVVGGAWVEGMYLTVNVTIASYQFAGFAEVLLKQKASFEEYLEITKPFADDPDVAELLKQLVPVKMVYEGIGTSLTQKQIDDLSTVIMDVRAKIVE